MTVQPVYRPTSPSIPLIKGPPEHIMTRTGCNQPAWALGCGYLTGPRQTTLQKTQHHGKHCRAQPCRQSSTCHASRQQTQNGVWMVSPECIAKGSCLTLGVWGRALFATRCLSVRQPLSTVPKIFGERFAWKRDRSDSCEIARNRVEMQDLEVWRMISLRCVFGANLS